MSGILIRNLKPENIKQGVEILNVKGTFEGGGSATVNNQDITVDSSIVEQSFTAGEGYTGLGTVTVNPYTLESKSVDSSTVSQTVATDKGLSSVTVNPYHLETKRVDSSTVIQIVTSEPGMSSVVVGPYVLDAKTVDSSTVQQIVTSDEDGLRTVIVAPYTLETKTVDSSTVAQVVTPDYDDALSSVTVNPYVLDTKTVDSSTVQQIVNSSADGMSSVTVSPYTLDSKTVDSSTVSQTVNSSADGLSSVTVNPYTLDSKTVDASTVSQTVNSSADGLSAVTVNAVTSSIDSNIQAGNIKRNITILGVTGTFDGSGGGGTGEDWIIAARNSSVPVDISTGGLEEYEDSMYNLFRAGSGYAGGDVSSAVMTGSYVGTRAMQGCFMGNGSIKSASFPDATYIGTDGLREAFRQSGLKTLSMPSLRYVYGGSMYCAFYGSQLEEVSLPELYEISGNDSLDSAFGNCPNLWKVSIPKLRSWIGLYGDSGYMFNGSPVTDITMHPDFLDQDSKINPLLNISTVTNIVLSDTAESDLYTGNSNLTYGSVLGILNMLDLTLSGKSVTFNNLVFDDTGPMQTAVDAATTAGWTLNNLTINHADIIGDNSINIMSGETGVYSFSTSGAWTITTSGNVTVSSSSGQGGISQSVNVTYTSGTASFTITCGQATKTVNIVSMQLMSKITTNGDTITTVALNTIKTMLKPDVTELTTPTDANIIFVCSGTNTSYYEFRLVHRENYNGSFSMRMPNTFDAMSETEIGVPFGTRLDNSFFGIKGNGNSYMYIQGSVPQYATPLSAIEGATGSNPMKFFESGKNFDVFGIKMYEGFTDPNSTGTLVHDYVPAYNGSEYGLYDQIDQVFYGGDTGGLITGTV